MEILCQRVTAFAIKNCNGKIPDQINFEKDDLTILDKFKSNLDLIRKKIDNQDVNFYIDSLLIVYLKLINILMIKNLGRKKII